MSHRLNIGFTLNSFRKGGIEKCTLELIIALQNAGHGVYVFLFNDIHELDSSSVQNLILCNSEHDCVIANKVRESHAKTPLDAVIHTRHSVRTPFIEQSFYIVHNVLSERLKSKGFFNRLKKTFRHRRELNNQRIICVSNAVKSDMITKVKVRPQSASVIYNGFDIKHIRELALHTPCQYSGHIVSVGSFNTVKRHDLLLRAFCLQKRFDNLVLVGDGKNLDAINRQIVELNIQTRVKLLGWQDNPYPVIKSADALIVSSDSESFSSVVAEALILGTPVVTTDCEGPREILGGTLQRYISPCGDAAALARNIESLNKDDFSHCEDIIKRLDMNQIVTKYEALITNREP